MIDDLIERVEKGAGADRELDAAIWCAVGWKLERRGKDRREWLYPPDSDRTKGARRDHTSLIDWALWSMNLTTSLDAVVSLIEAELPLSKWEVTTTGFKPGAAVIPNGSEHGGAYATSPARALLTATLRAIKETQHDR